MKDENRPGSGRASESVGVNEGQGELKYESAPVRILRIWRGLGPGCRDDEVALGSPAKKERTLVGGANFFL